MLLLDVPPLRREIAEPIALVLRVERIEPREIALQGALGGHVEIGLDPYGRIPEIDEFGTLEEDPVDDNDELRGPADAQHVGTQPVDVEPIEVVALG